MKNQISIQRLSTLHPFACAELVMQFEECKFSDFENEKIFKIYARDGKLFVDYNPGWEYPDVYVFNGEHWKCLPKCKSTVNKID